MKCPNCGMNYETKECPNCAAEKVVYSSSPQNTSGKIPQFRNEAEYDAYIDKQEEKKLEKGVDRWYTAFILFLILGFSNLIVEIIVSLTDGTYFNGGSGVLFGLAIVSLFFWYLGDIRRQLILLNKKRK